MTSDEDPHLTKVRFWSRLRRHKLAVAGLAVLIVIVSAAIFAKQLAPFDPNLIDNGTNVQPHWNGTPLPPCFLNGAQCWGHPLGTDEAGRDLLSRLLFGARISMMVGLLAVLVEMVIGTTLGSISGYYGGWIDWIIMRVTDVFLSTPVLPLLLVLTAVVAAGSTKAALNFGVIVLIIGGFSWMSAARLVRASFLSLREREFVEAARAVGNSDVRIIFRHVLPNATAPIVVQATLDVAGVIVLESTLSFLGFGIQPPTASWGSMLSDARSSLQTAWWAAFFPGLCILATVLAINYIGDGLRDALDPNMR
ncbi:MAG: ABC transporter permease [Candidatus Tumulicola sp.]